MNFTNFMLDDKIKAKAKYTQSRHQHELLQRINAVCRLVELGLFF